MKQQASIQPKTDSPYKYLISQYFKRLPNGTTETAFTDAIGVPKSTFRYHAGILIPSNSTISEYYLRLYAKAFGVCPEAICNYDININYKP